MFKNIKCNNDYSVKNDESLRGHCTDERKVRKRDKKMRRDGRRWRDGTAVTCDGRLLHRRAAATGNTLAPTVDRRVGEASKDLDEATRSLVIVLLLELISGYNIHRKITLKLKIDVKYSKWFNVSFFLLFFSLTVECNEAVMLVTCSYIVSECFIQNLNFYWQLTLTMSCTSEALKNQSSLISSSLMISYNRSNDLVQ